MIVPAISCSYPRGRGKTPGYPLVKVSTSCAATEDLSASPADVDLGGGPGEAHPQGATGHGECHGQLR